MKRTGIAVLALMMVMVLTGQTRADNSFSAAYDFDLSALTNTSMAVAFEDSNDVAPDSLIVISLPDSTYIAVLAAGAESGTLADLSPGIEYIMMLRTVRNDSVRVSNKDTLRTKYPEIDPNVYFNRFIQMLDATTWGSTEVSSLTVAGTSGADSTRIYRLQKYTTLQMKLTGTSPKVFVSVFPGHATTDVFGFNATAVDTFSVNDGGWSLPHLIENTGSAEHYYVRLEGRTGNSADTVAEVGYMASNE